MTLFLDGIRLQIWTVVALYVEDQKSATITYDRLVHYARDEGDAYRACNKISYGKIRMPMKAVTKNGRATTFKEPSSSWETVQYTPEAEEMYYVEDSISTVHLSWMEWSAAEVLYATDQGNKYRRTAIRMASINIIDSLTSVTPQTVTD